MIFFENHEKSSFSDFRGHDCTRNGIPWLSRVSKSDSFGKTGIRVPCMFVRIFRKVKMKIKIHRFLRFYGFYEEINENLRFSEVFGVSGNSGLRTAGFGQ